MSYLKWVARLCLMAGAGVLLAGFLRVELGDIAAREETRHLLKQVQQVVQPAPSHTGACVIHAGLTGHAFALLRIPSIGVRLPVVQGAAEAQLNTGAAGHVAGTGLPEHGNFALAAHVVSAGNPFEYLNELKVGDHVTVRDGCGLHRYRVTWTLVVGYRDTGVLRATSLPSVTLITCYPVTYYLTPWRTVVRAVQP